MEWHHAKSPRRKKLKNAPCAGPFIALFGGGEVGRVVREGVDENGVFLYTSWSIGKQ